MTLEIFVRVGDGTQDIAVTFIKIVKVCDGTQDIAVRIVRVCDGCTGVTHSPVYMILKLLCNLLHACMEYVYGYSFIIDRALRYMFLKLLRDLEFMSALAQPIVFRRMILKQLYDVYQHTYITLGYTVRCMSFASIIVEYIIIVRCMHDP